MITLIQQTSEQTTLTQKHYDMGLMNEIKKINLNVQLMRLENELQKTIKNLDLIHYLNTDISRIRYYIRNNK